MASRNQPRRQMTTHSTRTVNTYFHDSAQVTKVTKPRIIQLAVFGASCSATNIAVREQEAG
jgi:GTP cyclohydrolase FolE2